jgi:hypothetical protein
MNSGWLIGRWGLKGSILFRFLAYHLYLLVLTASGAWIVLDVNECSDRNGGCSHQCCNMIGSFLCRCPTGMTLSADRRTCTDESALNSKILKKFYFGMRALRIIRPWSVNRIFFSLDLDECASGAAQCQYRCENTYGGYNCLCPAGEMLHSDGRSCISKSGLASRLRILSI